MQASEIILRLLGAQMRTRFLILSGHIQKETIEELLQVGANGYIAKDEAIEWLVPAIKGVMKEAICLSPMVKIQLSGQNDKFSGFVCL